jgi:hypothetical protein
MRDAIPVATLVLAEILIVALGGMLMYRLVSGNTGESSTQGTLWRLLAGDRVCSKLFLV